MKKYLMMAAAALAFAGCSNHEIEYVDPSTLQVQKITKDYNDAFISTFGTPSATQTWGFGAATRSAQPNGNQWGTTDDNSKYIDYPQPAPITEAELAAVLEVFNQKGEKEYESLIDWQNFFVQQVYTGPNGSKMNELATTVDYEVETNVISWWPYKAETTVKEVAPFDDIINNFNAGNNTSWDGCMLMFNSATKDFSYKTSQSGGQRWYKHWRMEKINGNYYVGFDHEAVRQAEANDNEEDVRDYIYNDWIVKIVPGKGYTEPEDKVKEQGRIICEDLGAIGDFDFNDVVFDATVYESGKTYITLQAAGGTLELSVAGVEVHEALLGAENAKKGKLYKMINTGADATAEPYSFKAAGTYNSLKDIPVVVSKKDDAGLVTSYALTAEKGKAPQKICVPGNFRWCQETKSLKDAYPGFKDWATGDASVWSAANDNTALLY
ncbi:MAG: DUF4842 domain-containing protein [Prevotella sp.]|nr:DUF4842 domain-containing protein [Prevotella sp.]